MVGTIGLMGIILVGTSVVNAGMLISDRQIQNQQNTCGGAITMVESTGIIVLSRVLGVEIKVEPTDPCSDGMLISDRTGMLISD